MTLTAIRRDLGLGTGAAAMDVIGIDLSGPCNAADTAVAAFRANGRRLVLQERLVGADDAAIAALIARARPDADLVVGLDAPLSYNDGGGDRPADRLLRARAVAAGLLPGSIMPPTLTDRRAQAACIFRGGP